MSIMLTALVIGSLLTSCNGEDELMSLISSEINQDIQDEVTSAKSMSNVSYYVYEGISAPEISRYGHVYQDRTFNGWMSESSYNYTPNTNKGYPHPKNVTNNDYCLQYNGNCGVAAYVMARGLAYKDYSLFFLQETHSNASTRRFNTKIYCETSMRLHRAFPSNYNFGIPAIKYIYWIAKGDGQRISDVEFIKNPNNPRTGGTYYTNYFSSACSWTSANAYKTELENCMYRKAPFVTIVRIKPANHPAGNTRHNDNEYIFSGTSNVGDYIGSHSSQHYIVVVAMKKAFDSNHNFLEDKTIIYFLDPYYDYHTLWETTYSKLVSSAYLSSNNRNGFGLYRPDLGR